MTRPKPPGMRWESWIDRQVRDAQQRGEFEGLPGAGQPIPGLDKPHDENWWVREQLRREGLTHLPPLVALRKEANDVLTAALRASSEAELRKIITDVNAKIREANRGGNPRPRPDARPLRRRTRRPRLARAASGIGRRR